MDETSKMVYYSIMIINMFANKFSLTIRDAYFYLNKYKGLKFLKDFYDINHTLNSDDIVLDLIALCKKEGGDLSW